MKRGWHLPASSNLIMQIGFAAFSGEALTEDVVGPGLVKHDQRKEDGEDDRCQAQGSRAGSAVIDGQAVGWIQGGDQQAGI